MRVVAEALATPAGMFPSLATPHGAMQLAASLSPQGTIIAPYGLVATPTGTTASNAAAACALLASLMTPHASSAAGVATGGEQ